MEPDERLGIIVSYKLKYSELCLSNNIASFTTLTFYSSVYSRHITGLHDGVIYTFMLRACTSKGCGPWGVPVVIATNEKSR